MEPEIPAVRKQVLSKVCDNAVENQDHPQTYKTLVRKREERKDWGWNTVLEKTLFLILLFIKALYGINYNSF